MGMTKAKPISLTPRFYEMDGALRAYAHRSVVLAVLMGTVALIAVTGFLFARMEPPTVIRIGTSGEATVISPLQNARSHILPALLLSKSAAASPDEYEKEAFVSSFLNRYLNYDAHTLAENWADAINQMTMNLRRAALADLENNDTVGKLEQEQASSTFKLNHIEEDKFEPLVYTAFGVRTVRTLNHGQESIDRLVEEYHLRLVSVDRSARNPSGLLVGDYWSRQIEGEKREAVLAGGPFTANSTPAAETSNQP
jgi:hypothetical protein